MEKRKKMIISLIIALIIIVVANCTIIYITNSNYIIIPVFNKELLKGKEVTNKDISYIQVKNTNENKVVFQNTLSNQLKLGILIQDVSKGEIITNSKFISKEDVLDNDDKNYKYISIPVSELSYSTCNKLKRGDKITIYYTAKNKAVINAINDKPKLYSNDDLEGLVTCLLFDEVEVISTHDNTGKETNENIVTDILIRLNKEEAILVANLKSQGKFDVVLN